MASSMSSSSILCSSTHIDDFGNSYFLYHGDGPGTLLVTQLFTGSNYHTWLLSVIMALIAINKVSFINTDH